MPDLSRSEQGDLLRLALDAAQATRSAVLSVGDGGRSVRALRERGREVTIVADEVAHECVVSHLARSGLPILSEEGQPSARGAPPVGLTWVVDPLDGSVNFLRDSGPSAVALALCLGSTPVAGVISRLDREEVFLGGRTIPSTCNGSPIHCSQGPDASRSTLMTGVPTAARRTEAGMARVPSIANSFAKVRMIGSAAVSLCFVAAGRAEAYREEGIRLWDVAAGLAIVEGSGGWIRVTGKHPEPLDVLASGRLHRGEPVTDDAEGDRTHG